MKVKETEEGCEGSRNQAVVGQLLGNTEKMNHRGLEEWNAHCDESMCVWSCRKSFRSVNVRSVEREEV